jgi:uncharacterized repeat protein (TIGR03847 family)
MAPVFHTFDPPERFVAGTVGPPGQRTFFLQARSGTRVTSVALEKQQVAVLAERIDELLDELIRTGAASGVVPATSPRDLEDADPLDQPIVEEFRAGTMTLAWEPATQQVVVEVFPLTDDAFEDDDAEDDDADESDDTDDTGDAAADDADERLEVPAPEPEEALVVRLAPGVARAFSKRALSVVSAGRPPCQFCGGPLDPEGHLCPRSNGFRRSGG